MAYHLGKAVDLIRLDEHILVKASISLTEGCVPFAMMIYKAFALIYLLKCDIINSPINKNL